MSAAGNDDVLLRVEGRAGRITLNRPKALNALNWHMALAIEAALRKWAKDDAVSLVIIDASGDKAFCAGGDIAELYRQGRAGNLDDGRRFWADEYRLNAFIHHYPKPYVAIMDGIVMGGGVGLSAHGEHRVVTERSTIAMPECAIGLVPDVGASLILAKAPGRLGEYLGLTGFRMRAGDAILAGFADACVSSEKLEALKRRLTETGDPSVIGEFVQSPPTASLDLHREQIDRLFAGADAWEVVHALQHDNSEWAEEALLTIRKGSAVSVAATLAIIHATRAKPTIEAALRHEYRFTWRSQSEGDLQEGIRAAVIDKDRSPHWMFSKLEDMPREKLEAMTALLGTNELQLEESA